MSVIRTEFCKDELQDTYKDFLELEADLSLFEWRESGIPLWERLRFSVYMSVLQASGIFGQPQSSIEKNATDFIRGGFLWARNFAFRNPFFGNKHDFLIWGHQRRKKLEDGYWWDLYVDPIIEELSLDHQYVESDHNLTHHRPPKTHNVDYIDLITFSSTVYRKLSGESERRNSPWVTEIEAEHEERFGVDLDIGQLVYEELTDRRVYLPLYRRLLKRVSPEIAFVIVSYGCETFIEACSEADIPVVELQHGTIDKYHLGYSFPGDREKQYAPDFLFTFGPSWADGVELPIDEENVYPVGYQHLEREYNSYQDIKNREEVVFISQGTIGERLSKLATNLSTSLSESTTLTYKLHPGEYSRWRGEYPWLQEANINVVADEVPLYELLSRASMQVGVYSTAIYEGLRFGTPTILVNTSGISHMERLVTKHDVPVVSSADELETVLLSAEEIRINPRLYFCESPIDNFEQALESIRNQ
jgi:hypothetical protein